MTVSEIDTNVPPSGTGCVECDAAGGWWVHLRCCATCGHIGCCDSSPAHHATAHFRETGHRYIRSFEPGETWFWDYVTEQGFDGPTLAPPESRPAGQSSPGPQERLPGDWQAQLARIAGE